MDLIEVSWELKEGLLKFGKWHEFSDWEPWAGILPTGSDRFGRQRRCIYCNGSDIKAGGAGSRWVEKRLLQPCFDSPDYEEERVEGRPGYEQLREETKEWQRLAGRFASLANHLANIIIERYNGKISSNELDDANDAIDEVADYLMFDDKES